MIRRLVYGTIRTARGSVYFNRHLFASFAVKKSKKEVEKADKIKTRETAEIPETIDLHAMEEQYKSVVSGLGEILAKLKFGVLTPETVGDIQCQAYGEESSVSDLAQVTMKNDTTASITPYDTQMIDNVKKVLCGL